MDIETVCYIWSKRAENTYSYGERFLTDDTLYDICRDVENWKDNPTLREYLEPLVLEKANVEFYERRLKETKKHIRATGGFCWDEFGQTGRAIIDGLESKNFGWHEWDYIAIIGEDKSKYNEEMKTFNYAFNGGRECRILPARKGTQKLEVGKFYKIKCEEVNKGRYKEFKYEYEEISEEEYLWESLLIY